MHCSFRDIASGEFIEVDLNEKDGLDKTSKVEETKKSIDEFLIE